MTRVLVYRSNASSSSFLELHKFPASLSEAVPTSVPHSGV